MIDNETKFEDLAFDEFDLLMSQVREENNQQIYKWGIQQATLQEWMLWLTEEVGELSEAMSELMYNRREEKEGKRKVRDEAIQVATLALKIAEMVQFNSIQEEE